VKESQKDNGMSDILHEESNGKDQINAGEEEDNVGREQKHDAFERYKASN
jgi:hypothetical protein